MDNDLIEDYINRYSLRQLREKYNVSDRYIYKVLKANSIDELSRKPKWIHHSTSILKEYDNGLSISQIGKILKVRNETVIECLNYHNKSINILKESTRDSKLSIDDINSIKRKYVNGTSISSLMKTYSVGYNKIAHVIKDIDQSVHNKISLSKDELQSAVFMRKEFKSYSYIANELGVSRTVIQRELNEQSEKIGRYTSYHKLLPHKDIISKEYVDGKSSVKIAKEFDVCSQTIIKFLRNECSLEIRSRGLNPKTAKRSVPEKTLFEFVKQYDSNVISNSRSIVNKHELDIYSDKYKLAIEYNGLYFHSDAVRPNIYHSKKTDDCIKAGITLIQLYEDEWKQFPDIVKQIITNKMSSKVYDYKIMNIDKAIAKQFILNNHIFGECVFNNAYGLFIENALVGCVAFYENLLTCVCGTYNFDYSEFKKYIPDDLVVYNDLRWNLKKSFCEDVGLIEIGITSPIYEWVKDGYRSESYEMILEKFKHKGNPSANTYRIFNSGYSVYTKKGIPKDAPY